MPRLCALSAATPQSSILILPDMLTAIESLKQNEVDGSEDGGDCVGGV